MADACARLLDILGGSGELRRVAVWKLEGYTNAEIAALPGRSVSAVERKLNSIRAIWARESTE